MEIAYTVVVGSINTPNSYLLPLADFFDFNPFFLVLPDVISNNIPVLFFKNILNSLLILI